MNDERLKLILDCERERYQRCLDRDRQAYECRNLAGREAIEIADPLEPLALTDAEIDAGLIEFAAEIDQQRTDNRKANETPEAQEYNGMLAEQDWLGKQHDLLDGAIQTYDNVDYPVFTTTTTAKTLSWSQIDRGLSEASLEWLRPSDKYAHQKPQTFYSESARLINDRVDENLAMSMEDLCKRVDESTLEWRAARNAN